jgi:hypothetical protein
MKKHEVFQQAQKCGGAKTHKGRSPTAFLRNPTDRKGGSSYRLLCDGFSAFIYNYYLFNNTVK